MREAGALSQRAWQRSVGWVRPRFVEGGGQLDRRRTRRVLNPCVRESKARTGGVLKKRLISDYSLFSPYVRSSDDTGVRVGVLHDLFCSLAEIT